MIAEGIKKLTHDDVMFLKEDHQTHIEIPEGVVALEDGCFKGFTELESITFPKSLQSIGMECFSGCSALKEISFHESMKISWYCFKNCHALKTVEIPEDCVVGDLAFWYCENLTSVRLPRKAKISWSAFSDCTSIETVYAPEDTDYHQLFKRFPKACRILNTEGAEVPGMRLLVQEWEGVLPEEALLHMEKLQGLPLEEQLQHCYIVETTSEESTSYGESNGAITRESRVHMERSYEFDILLVRDGTVAGFIDLQGKAVFLGQIYKAYSSVDSDGTGSTYTSSESRLKVMEL